MQSQFCKLQEPPVDTSVPPVKDGEVIQAQQIDPIAEEQSQDLLWVYILVAVLVLVVCMAVAVWVWVRSKKTKERGQFDQIDLSRTTSMVSAATRKDTEAEPPQMHNLESPRGTKIFDTDKQDTAVPMLGMETPQKTINNRDIILEI